MLRVLTDEPTRERSPSVLDEIVREGARRMLAAALEAEVAAYVEAHAIIPPWCRKRPKVPEARPLMYLHGMSTGDFVPWSSSASLYVDFDVHRSGDIGSPRVAGEISSSDF